MSKTNRSSTPAPRDFTDVDPQFWERRGMTFTWDHDSPAMRRLERDIGEHIQRDGTITHPAFRPAFGAPLEKDSDEARRVSLDGADALNKRG